MNEIILQTGRQPLARRDAFVFNGSGREYFGIWVVNVLLTILTFGIYSAGAKVRRQRYFYGNTDLAGRRHARFRLAGRACSNGRPNLLNLTHRTSPRTSLRARAQARE